MTGSIGPSYHARPPEPHKTPNPKFEQWMQDKEDYVQNLTEEYTMVHMGQSPDEGQIMLWREQFEQENPKPPEYLLG